MNTTGVEKSVLNNGIRVLTKKMPHLRSVSMGVWVHYRPFIFRELEQVGRELRRMTAIT